MTLRRATVVGAGRIGLYLGGCLLYAGWKVRFVGRKEFGNQIAENGALILSNLQQQFELKFDNDLFTYKEKLEKGDIESGDFLIICVKRADSEKIAQELLALEISNFNLISFQNGVDNTKTYCDILKNVQFTPISAIFGPNVIKVDDQIAHFKLATSNPIIIEQTEHSEILQAAFTHGKTAEGPFLECEITQNLRGVMFGKLMLNLNNSINALTGLPLKDELRSKKCRKVLSYAMSESLAAMKANNITPVGVSPLLVPKTLPYLMMLPNFLYLTLASNSLKIDPSARSSMWDDLSSGRKTEIDYLNGVVVQMGKAHNIPTPVNDALCSLIKKAEEEKKSPNLSPEELYQLIWP